MPRNLHRTQLLARVCRQWRDLAHSSPPLWSSIHIVVPPKSLSRISAIRLEALSEWLARSGTVPLHISIFKDRIPYAGLFTFANPNMTYVGKHSDGTVDAFLSLLLPHASRWRTMRLYMPPCSASILASLSSSDVPNLKTFSLIDAKERAGTFEAAETSKWTDMYNFLADAENLQDVSFLFPAYEFSDRVWVPAYPKRNITDLCIDHQRFDVPTEVIAFLSELPNLQSCKLSFFPHMSTYDTPPRPAPILLPHLRLLQLRTIRNMPVTQQMHTFQLHVLRGLSTPAIECLDVSIQNTSFASRSEPAPFAELLQFLEVSQIPPLKILKLHMLNMNATADESLVMFQCLDLLTNLEELAFHYQHGPIDPAYGSFANDAPLTQDSLLISNLIDRPNSEPLLPNLRKLTILHSHRISQLVSGLTNARVYPTFLPRGVSARLTHILVTHGVFTTTTFSFGTPFEVPIHSWPEYTDRHAVVAQFQEDPDSMDFEVKDPRDLERAPTKWFYITLPKVQPPPPVASSVLRGAEIEDRRHRSGLESSQHPDWNGI